MGDCCSLPRRRYTRPSNRSIRCTSTITMLKSISPTAKPSCATAGWSSCDSPSRHTWSHWRSSRRRAERRTGHLALQIQANERRSHSPLRGVEHQACFYFDCPPLEHIWPHFPLTHGSFDGLALFRGRADDMDMLHAAVGADDDSHGDGR